MVEQLRKQLREKDMVLTDIRLEALSSAHQLESLKDTVIKMRVRDDDFFFFKILSSYVRTRQNLICMLIFIFFRMKC